jgi:sterol desaturase/sphingolipid hydroxylase (fatty acid hydroxylase superfamily)
MENLSTYRLQPIGDRVVNTVWAICLLLPLSIIAENVANRIIFHALLLCMGWFCWAYTEYFVHRFVMHNRDQKNGIGKMLNHTHHHTDPEDIRISNIHRALLIVISATFVILSARADNYLTVFCGYIVGFTIYSFMHVVLHHKWSQRIFPALHRFHIMHHCKYTDKCFGVVFTGWDYLFGTVPVNDIEVTARIKQFYYKKEKQKATRKNLTDVCSN